MKLQTRGNKINGQTGNRTRRFIRYSVEALAYLPNTDDEERAFIKLPGKVDVVRNEHKWVNYVVTRSLIIKLGNNITSRWSTIENNAKRILEFTL